MIIVVARRKHELQVRAQLLAALTEPSVTLRGLTNRADPHSNSDVNASTSTVELRAEVLIEGNPATALDALVTRLSLEPGIHSVAWRSEDPDPLGDDDRDLDLDEGPNQRVQ